MSIGIITGASSGFGKEFSKRIKKYYPNINELWIIARSEEKLIKLKDEIKDEFVNIKLGNAYKGLSNLTMAIQYYNKAIEINSENPDSYFNRGLCLAEMNDLDARLHRCLWQSARAQSRL